MSRSSVVRDRAPVSRGRSSVALCRRAAVLLREIWVRGDRSLRDGTLSQY